jgi:hypothetical protein
MADIRVTKNKNTVAALHQWDVDQTLVLTVEGLPSSSALEVHFAQEGTQTALIPETVVDSAGVARTKVPNCLLQAPRRITAYVCVREGDTFATLYRIAIPVIARAKPDDYVYTETEVLTYRALEQRVSDLEAAGVSPDQIAAAVEHYLQENPVKQFETDETLTLSPEGVLSVNRAEIVEQDNTLPITSAAVYETVGNINALLATI